ncbi:MAG: 50S ribosomal protein L25 [Verrucomicrobiales bacterium]|nr:50S ribosomal protein L25 [Verrucomicrobiales bacterium]|tara:strand:- start:2024 stop:2665 length:642 start_codon:yes stop_codon:yes gene_type:complete
MKAISLAANERELIKTTGSKKLRNSGRLPGILYGSGDPTNIELESIQFEKAIKSTEAKNFLVELDLNGSKSMALVQDLQRHPISRLCIHVDFRRLSEDSIISAKIPLHTTGTPEGVKVGGILQTMSHNLTLRGKALDIPERIEIDTSHLKVGEGLLLDEVTLPEGVTAVGNPKSRIVAVAASRITAKAGEAGEGTTESTSSTEADSSVEKKED